MTAIRAVPLSHRSRVAALTVGIVLAACGPTDEAPPVDTPPEGVVRLTAAQAERSGLRVEARAAEEIGAPLRIPAELAPPDTARAVLGSIVEGRIEQVRVLPGDAVSEGDPLVYIHSHEMMDARRDLRAAEAELSYADNALGRSRQLLAAGAVSQEEVERREADRAAAEADVRRAQELVGHLDPSSEGDVTVRALRNGVVLAVHVEPGEAVMPGDPVVEVGALRPLWAVGHVSEDHVAWLAPGLDARIALAAFPGRDFAARLVRVGGQVDALTRTVDVRVEAVELPDGARPGMFAEVELSGADRVRGIVVPGDAVQQLDGVSVVFVEVGELEFRGVPVGVVALGEDRLLVTGLDEAARVVMAGAPFLKAAIEGAAAEGADGTDGADGAAGADGADGE